MRYLPAAVSFLAAISIAGASAQPITQTKKASDSGAYVTTPSGLKYKDSVVGTGGLPTAGHPVTVTYTGWLYINGKKGSKFDSSLDHPPGTFQFPIGQHQVIAGWDEGVATMHVGGKRTLIIPPNLGYGPRGMPPVIPGNSTLMFDVELKGV